MSRESGDSQTFWNEFFAIFGIDRKRVATFEVPVQLREGHGRIDLFWPAVLLVEHKSAGEDLDAAFTQAADYFDGIPNSDLPTHVVVSDFKRLRLYNLEDRSAPVEFLLAELHKYVGQFSFLTGRMSPSFVEVPAVNIKAAEKMAELHNALRQTGYAGHRLAVLLVRIMFCLFADHTGIFSKGLFGELLRLRTRADGSDTGLLLNQIFSILDQPLGERQTSLDEDLAGLPYVDGRLFEEPLPPPAFDRNARDILLACLFDWTNVSPAIFGSMFQKVIDEDKGRRREIGAFYTSEINILKAIGPLFLDGLRTEFETVSRSPAANSSKIRSLVRLLARIAEIVILDPACGCGNFLIIAYRELRLLELDIHRKLLQLRKREGQRLLSIDFTKGINVDAMYGIEIEEFPCRVAETALYLIDHLTNNKASEEFGENFTRLPLSKAPHITQANALRIDWSTVLPAARVTAVVGNPPYVAKADRSPEQVADMDAVFGNWDHHGDLDYVSSWFVKALDYVKGTTVPVAFVATNSITQGEQVPILWPTLLKRGLKIRFAHRTFQWKNDAPGQAAVFCVIVGWGLHEPSQRLLFHYETPRSEPIVVKVKKINPYLVDYDDVFLRNRRKAICDVPPIKTGSMPNDAGNLVFEDEEYKDFIAAEPGAAPFMRPYLSSKAYFADERRWCLWLKDAPPSVIRRLPLAMERVERVRRHRIGSDRPATKRLAATPALFGEDRQPNRPYILIPEYSTASRTFIPITMYPPEYIVSNLCKFVDSDDLYVFGVLQSMMHMAWWRGVGGRMKGDPRYSNEIVYNNFPWPEGVSDPKRARVRKAARRILDTRNSMADQSLADLYSDVMPVSLLKAHKDLDKVVDFCYTRRKFNNELERVKFLFERYTALAGPLVAWK